jgi:uncharacterized damage-inducible protein DinB
MTDPRYPIGKYEERPFSLEQKQAWFADLRFLPKDLEMAVQDLDAHQLDTPYREGGWSVKQVVHHVADSHMNALIRFKLGLTEDNPTIKPYDEALWAKLDDVDTVPINVSLTILYGVHQRLVKTLENITEEQWQRTLVHPEHQRQMTLWYLLGNYAWHGKHHVAHITSLRERNNW